MRWLLKMEIVDYFEFIKEEIDLVEQKLRDEITSPIEIITDIAGHILEAGGKRIRPALLIVSARLFNYNQSIKKRAVNLGTAIELIHMGGLIHDDIVDNAGLRRGRVSAHQKWGDKLALLVADYLASRANLLINQENDRRIIENLAQMIYITCEGALQEASNLYNYELSEEEYFQIITKKTALLIACCCQIGAFLGKSRQKEVKNIYDFGLNAGIAFQIIDDLFDVTATVQEIGKPVINDISQGKFTLPWLYALKKASAEEKNDVSQILATRRITYGDKEKLFQLLRKYNGLDDAMEVAKHYVKKALNELNKIKRKSEAKNNLEFFAQYFLDRSY